VGIKGSMNTLVKCRRRSIRLRGYDYSTIGAYFVTICAYNRKCLFGQIVDEQVQLTDVGEMVRRWVTELERKFSSSKVDTYVIMPNHWHGIICLGQIEDSLSGIDRGQGALRMSDIVGWFKTMTSNEYLRQIRVEIHQQPLLRLWQRNYYEHVVRNDDELNRIRQYIADNPIRWEEDRENPAGHPKRMVEGWQV
jgi:putative transposase